MVKDCIAVSSRKYTTGGFVYKKNQEKKENYDFFGGIASRSSDSVASFFCIDIPMKATTKAVNMIPPSRRVVAGELGNAKVSIRIPESARLQLFSYVSL